MSTRDGGGALDLPGPGLPSLDELRLALSPAPPLASAPSGAGVPGVGPTPGLSAAAITVPGAPTLPSWDPAALAVLIQRLASEGSPAAASAPDTPGGPTGTTPTPAFPGGLAPASLAPSPPPPSLAPSPAAAPPVPASWAAPFSTPPSFEALFGGGPLALGDPFATPASGRAPGLPASTTVPLLDARPATPLDERSAHAAAPAPGPPAAPLGEAGAGGPPEGAVGPAPLPVPPPTGVGSPGALDHGRAPPRSATADDPQAPAPLDLVLAEPWSATAPAVPALEPRAASPFDAAALRREFPILEERVHGRRLVWLDNAATTQKPLAVIDRLVRYYRRENSNVHRAAHTLAGRATDAYEAARETVRRFLNASSPREIVWVRGATEGLNLIAQAWGRRHVHPGDEIVITWLEHHANIVPWQQLACERGARLRVAPVDDRGQVRLDEYERLLGPRTRLVSLSQVSNALGTVTPAREMVAMARRHGATVVVDGAQAVAHLRVDVQALDCDFYVFSGHKVFGPTGIGAVYGRGAVLDETPPWQGGGNMIEDVTFERTRFQGPPARFEAGTGNIADAVGLGAALDWLTRVGLEAVARHEHELLEYATDRLLEVPGLRIIGTAPDKAGVISFVLAGQKTEEVGGLLDREGIAVRSGHHCAQPILRRFGLEATVRASLAPYNTREDIDALAAALRRLQVGR